VNDGVTISSTGTSTVTVQHTAPTITASGIATFSGGGSPVALDPTISIADVDSNGNLTGANVWINSGSLSGDMLNYASLAGLGITGSYNASTGTLTLSGTSSIANYESALASVTYNLNPSNGDPTGGGSDLTRTIGWSVTDGSSSNGISNTGSSVLDVLHVAPTVAASGTATFNGGDTPITLDPTLSLADADSNGMLTGASVSIGSGFQSTDILSIAGQTSGLVVGTNITATYDAGTGVLTLSGGDTLANYTAALREVTFSSLSNSDPTASGTDTSRTINWTVIDGNSANGVSNFGSSAIDVVHTPPTISVGGTSVFTDGGPAVSLASAIGITDPDSSGILASAT